MILVVGLVVLLMGLYLLIRPLSRTVHSAPQVSKSIPSDIGLRAGLASPAAIGFLDRSQR
jgi:hypothetical protein